MRLTELLQPKKLALIVLIPMLSACTVDADPGYSRPPPPRPSPSQPQMCTMEYAPVCGERGGRTQTFGNACQARNSGFRIVGRGECRRQPPITPPRPEPPRPPRPERPEPPTRPGGICTREYRPVCGQRGPQMQTFPNACEAGNSGFRIVAQGQCRR
ncbi:Kazal-type serine protease inhibitor [Rhizobium sp. S152]|uniref:Kazal-type serine protease inhibitor family protein n=1 Tax=Rhizobium sp. S152 TaxID=3055038 RepID=UPI0025A95941|nr:Kazal-type serine protease inhibitor [Rhizobium sp. S152]MDM9628820.1 Kazal-type serine protease inhibitor [Rhizobium sp. S152]